MLDHPLVQFGIGGKGDVFLLNRGINQNFSFLGLFTVKRYGCLQDFSYTFCKVLRVIITFLGILDKLNRIFCAIKSVSYPVFQGRLFTFYSTWETDRQI